jgi:hypothetical protein
MDARVKPAHDEVESVSIRTRPRSEGIDRDGPSIGQVGPRGQVRHSEAARISKLEDSTTGGQLDRSIENGPTAMFKA